MSRSKSPAIAEHGFTIAELIVAITVFAVIGVTFIGLTANYFVTINRTNQMAEMTVMSQNLLRTTVENIRYGDGVRQTSQLSDPNAPAGGWNTNNSDFVIIIPVPAMTSSHQYIINPDTGDPYMNELVYYKSGSSLMQRRIANPNATGTTLTTSCPSSSATSTCPADIELAKYVSSMLFTLYDQDGVQTNTPTDARSVLITLTMQRNAPGNPLRLNTNIRVTLRNRFE